MAFARGIGSGLSILLLATQLVACKAPLPAPVVELQPPPTRKIMHHFVSRGETLYAIAWRYELDVVKLAAANGIAQPYNLRPGQRLNLDTSKVRIPEASPPPSRPAPVVRKSAQVTIPTDKSSAQREPAGSAPKSVPPNPLPGSVAARTTTVKMPVGEPSWRWPVTGKVTREYDSSRVFKGISIQTTPGRAVLAAAPGVVVYAGDGLRGYGKLIIIKHSDTHLSAYAHNRRIFVSEGSEIAVNQKISEVGGDPQNRGRLYFEIRQNGRPIDPMRLLPRQ